MNIFCDLKKNNDEIKTSKKNKFNYYHYCKGYKLTAFLLTDVFPLYKQILNESLIILPSRNEHK